MSHRTWPWFARASLETITTISSDFSFMIVGQNHVIAAAILVPRTIIALTTPPTISVGTNAASYNNIVAVDGLAVGLDVGEHRRLVLLNDIPLVSSTSDVRVNVSVAAVATSYVIDVFLLGAEV